MPKPLPGIPGSGMHVNMSLSRGGQNLFSGKSGPEGLSLQASQFLAGLLDHAGGFCAVTNPLVNSYKRLVPGYEAPCHVTWSAANRSALIRVPSHRDRDARLELRSPDPACNPYLAFVVCLAGGAEVLRAVRRLGSAVVICGFYLSDMTADTLAEDLRGLAVVLVVAKAAYLELCGGGPWTPGSSWEKPPGRLLNAIACSGMSALCTHCMILQKFFGSSA